MYPGDAPLPNTSNLNWAAGDPPTPNKVDTDLSADGGIKLTNSVGTVHVAVDLVGYYVDHTHDDRYDTKGQTDSKLATKADVGAGYTKSESDARFTTEVENDARYYTKSQSNARYANFADLEDVLDEDLTIPGVAATPLRGTSISLSSGCAVFSTDAGGELLLPIALPTGTTVAAVTARCATAAQPSGTRSSWIAGRSRSPG